MKTKFAQFIVSSPKRIAFTIGVYAGLEVIGNSVLQAVRDAKAQTEAALALHEHFKTPVLLTAMDLSVEAEVFGCQIRFTEEEIPTVIGRRVTTPGEVSQLPDPQVGDGRTRLFLETAKNLVKAGKNIPVLGGLIGPISLAGRIFGVSEALEASVLQPEIIHEILKKVTRFTIQYARAFHESGAAGVVMAEPLAGLLSPRGLGQFSAPYIHEIIQAVQTESFAVILHNCGARLVHLPQVLKSGAEIYHFGAPMDLLAALQQVEGRVVLGGNLDPTAVFHNGSALEVEKATCILLEKTKHFVNFFPSSGCDLPPGTPAANLAAFYGAVNGGE